MASFDPNAEDPARSAAKAAALSGALSGGALGLGTAVLGGKRKLLDLLKASLIGGGAAASLAGGATYAGSKLLGAPDADDDSAYTTRGAVGGALGAGTLGAMAGGSLGAGLLRNIPKAGIADNIIMDALKNLGRKGGTKSALLGAGLGGLTGALVGGHVGADEGMQLDFINNQTQKARRERLRQAMAESMLNGG